MFSSKNSISLKYSLLLLAIATISGNQLLNAQNRYGASPDFSYQINAVKGRLDTTTQRVEKLEGEMDNIKLHLGYDKVTPSSDKPTSKNNSPTKNANSNGTHHFVLPGDTLSSISRHYRVGVDRLVAENHIPNPNTLHPGQKILIPGQK